MKKNPETERKKLQWPDHNSDNFDRLVFLKWRDIRSPDDEFRLITSKPGGGSEELYEEIFSDPETTQHLTISPDFDPNQYIKENNGDWGDDFNSSPTSALFLIFKRGVSGPIGHASIKDIDWEELSFHRGIVIKKKFWGQKIAPKVGYTILKRMQELGFKTAYTEVKLGHVRSLNAVKKQFGEGVLGSDGKVHFQLDLTQPLVYNPFEDQSDK